MSAMENVVLYYFPIKGMAESIRMLLSYGGQDFKDVRMNKEEWLELKPNTPFGQVPVLDVNGKRYGQSLAIARYLGYKYGLAGDSLEDALEIDQNIDHFTDIRIKASNVHAEQDPAVKEKKHQQLAQDYYPQAMQRLHDILTKNNAHIALGKLTWGDFVLAGQYDVYKMVLQIPSDEFDEKYPNFKKLRDNVVSIPKVKEYCDAAPECPY